MVMELSAKLSGVETALLLQAVEEMNQNNATFTRASLLNDIFLHVFP
jgi:hypothetical protein